MQTYIVIHQKEYELAHQTPYSHTKNHTRTPLSFSLIKNHSRIIFEFIPAHTDIHTHRHTDKIIHVLREMA